MSPTRASGPLRGEGLVVRRAGRTILDGVGVTVEPGTMLAISGHSGAGKTTLLMVLAGIIAPDSGDVSYAGGPVLAGDDEHLRRCGYVAQSYGLVPVLTASENVELPMQLRGAEPADVAEEARLAMTRVGLPEVLERLVEDLSGGQQQRVAVARALVGGPELLLADEPTSELDGDNRDRVVSALRAEAFRGAVVILTTHDPDVADACDEELRLDSGARLDLPAAR